jgi:uncharacterized protein
MQIQLSGLPKGPQAFSHKCKAGEYLDDRDTFPGNMVISATIAKEGNALRLNLDMELPGHFVCDRCGGTFDQLHHCSSEYFFAFDETGEIPDYNPEIAVIPKGAINLDVSQEIRDTVILGLPSKILCREDCRGICPRCGANLNETNCDCIKEAVDPRWEALQNLKHSNE